MTALPPLAEVLDLSAWLGRDIPNEGTARAEAVLSHASNRVRSYTGQRFEDEDAIPPEVADVVVRMAARVWRNPEDLDSVTLDDGTKRWGSVRGLVMTDSDREDLAPWRANQQPAGLGVVSTYRGDLDLNDTVYVPTGPPPSGYPFPWYSTGDLP